MFSYFPLYTIYLKFPIEKYPEPPSMAVPSYSAFNNNVYLIIKPHESQFFQIENRLKRCLQNIKKPSICPNLANGRIILHLTLVNGIFTEKLNMRTMSLVI